MWQAGNGDMAGLDVLIVDDHAQTRQILGSVIKGFGVGNVRTAHDGVSALDEIGTRAPHVVILDWEMHPMNGEQLLKTMRSSADPAMALIPAIVLTAHSNAVTVRQARESGANSVIVKPIVPQRLFDHIRKVLVDRRAYTKQDGRFVPVSAPKEKPAAQPVDDSWLLD